MLWQENLRAIRARDAYRAKAANAAEKKRKEKVSNERGELAAVKELRQKMFDQQRQYVLTGCVFVTRCAGSVCFVSG